MLKRLTMSVAAACLATAALAEDFPGSRPVMMMMPYAAGGPGDVITRVAAAGMNKVLGGQIIVENIGGAGGTIGTAKVAASAPDGHSLLVMHFGHAANTALYPNLRYDAVKDFEPIGIIAESPMSLVARKDFPANNLKDFLAYVKANKDKLSYGFAGIGSASHLCGLLFFDAIGTNVTNVPYKGTGPALADLIAVRFHVRSDAQRRASRESRQSQGLCRDDQRAARGVPRIADGVGGRPAGFEIMVWFAMYAPKGTPKPKQLSKALQQALEDPDVKARFAGSGAQTVSQERATPAALQAFLKSEIDKWVPIINVTAQ